MSATLSILDSSSSVYSREDKVETYGHSGKVAITPHTPKLWLRYWIHMLAPAITAGVTVINFLNLYLMDVDDPLTVVKLGAFQFAAKLHEVSIVGSLVLVILDTVRSHLIAGSVPLGLLLSHVLFTDLDWLISPQFWSCMKPTTTTLPLILLLLSAIPFSNLAGPLSAIAIVPRLGWSESTAAQVFPTFWNTSAATLWPKTLSAEMLPPDCFGLNPDLNSACPTNVYRSLESNSQLNMLCSKTGPEFSCNASTETSATSSIFRQMSAEFNINDLTVFSSTPTTVLFDLLANRFASGMALNLNISDTETIDSSKIQLIEVKFLGNQQMQKPVVKASCESLSYVQAYNFIQQNNFSDQFGAGALTFLGDIDGSNDPKLLYTIDRRSTTLVPSLRGGCQGEGCLAAFMCTADARWASVKLWYNTAQSTLLFQSAPQPKSLFESLPSTSRVRLKKDWLDTLGNLGGFNASEEWPSYSFGFGAQFPFDGPPPSFTDKTSSQQLVTLSNYTQALSMQFSMMLTLAMAQAQSATGQSLYTGNCSDVYSGFMFDKRICARDPSYWIHSSDLGSLADNASAAVFTVRRSGYRWGLDSILVIMALSALLLHSLLTLAYVIYIIAVKKQLTTKWASAPEILMLAINSIRAPLLMGHSTGTSRDSSNLWQQPVSIREMENHQELSLIVGNPNDYRGRVGGRPVIGKKYA